MKNEGFLRIVLYSYLGLLLAFIFAPIAFSVIFSFNSARFPTIPLSGFTLQWYKTIWHDPDIWEAAKTSLIVSLSVATISTFLGFTAAYTDFRYSFKLKPFYLAIILLPPTIPLIILALAMLAWFSKIGISGQVVAVIIAHTVLTAPFAMAIIRLRLSQMDLSLEAAAWNLGANQWTGLKKIVIPFCRPALISSFCLTAAVSFDEFAIAWFISGLNKTVPVVILEIVTGNIDPQVNAIGSLVFLTSMTLVIIAQVVSLTRNKTNDKTHG